MISISHPIAKAANELGEDYDVAPSTNPDVVNELNYVFSFFRDMLPRLKTKPNAVHVGLFLPPEVLKANNSKRVEN